MYIDAWTLNIIEYHMYVHVYIYIHTCHMYVYAFNMICNLGTWLVQKKNKVKPLTFGKKLVSTDIISTWSTPVPPATTILTMASIRNAPKWGSAFQRFCLGTSCLKRSIFLSCSKPLSAGTTAKPFPTLLENERTAKADASNRSLPKQPQDGQWAHFFQRCRYMYGYVSIYIYIHVHMYISVWYTT